MILEQISTEQAPTPSGNYSQALRVGEFIFLAGQRPVDPATGTVPVTFREQVERALHNVLAVLEASGTDLAHVVHVRAYLADLADFTEFNAIFGEWFRSPYPVRTTVGVQLRGVRVELEVVAVLAAVQQSPLSEAASDTQPRYGKDQ